MKNYLLRIGIFALLVSASAFTFQREEAEPLKIGDPAPLTNRSLTTTAGTEVTLASVKGEGGLLVIFSCNTCPWVEKWEDRYHTVASAASSHSINTILLNSNEALRDGEESLDAMKKRAASMSYSFPYAVDPNAELADAFGANRTPEVYLFDKDLKLIYHGAIDDNARDASAVESPYLMDAIAAYGSGKAIQTAETKSIGCTIKRKR